MTPTLVDPVVTSSEGPREDCGWRVSERGRSVPLDSGTIEFDWWVRIGFLASQRTPITVTAGDVTREAIINPGLGSLYVQATAVFDEIEISGLAPGTTLCVDAVEVGVPVSGVS